MVLGQNDSCAGRSAERLSDADPVRRCQRNLEEFVALYDRNVEAIYRYCSRRLPRATAEDATSTTFLNAITAMRDLDPNRVESLRPWLFIIAPRRDRPASAAAEPTA